MTDRRDTTIYLYLIVTLLTAVYLLIVFLVGGSSGLEKIFRVGPGSFKSINIFAIGASWLLVGALIVLFRWPPRARAHRFFIVLFILLAFFHLNLLREPHLKKVGDFGFFWKNMKCVEAGKPVLNCYNYPPLMASLLQPFSFLKSGAASNYFKMTNYAAVLLWYLLLYLLLQRYGFSRHLAAAAPFVLLLFDVPLYRGLVYQQVTIHAYSFILLSLFFYGRSDFLSAAALCCAVNLKVTPAVLLLPFLFLRRWRWLFFFFMAQALIVAYTCWMSGARYWYSFVVEGANILEGAYRNSSIDSLMYNVFRLSNLDLYRSRAVAAVAKIFFLVVTIRLWFRASHRGLFYSGERESSFVYNGYVVLSLFMVIISPRMWAHYFIFLILPFLVMLTCVSGKREIILYATSYLLIFLIPVFDLFPLSSHRLVGVLLCYWLCWIFSTREVRRGIGIMSGFEKALAAAAGAWREGKAA